jgi:hypothetical protein
MASFDEVAVGQAFMKPGRPRCRKISRTAYIDEDAETPTPIRSRPRNCKLVGEPLSGQELLGHLFCAAAEAHGNAEGNEPQIDDLSFGWANAVELVPDGKLPKLISALHEEFCELPEFAWLHDLKGESDAAR